MMITTGLSARREIRARVDNGSTGRQVHNVWSPPVSPLLPKTRASLSYDRASPIMNERGFFYIDYYEYVERCESRVRGWPSKCPIFGKRLGNFWMGRSHVCEACLCPLPFQTHGLSKKSQSFRQQSWCLLFQDAGARFIV